MEALCGRSMSYQRTSVVLVDVGGCEDPEWAFTVGRRIRT